MDIIGDAGPELYARTVDVVAKDPNTDGLLVVLTPQAMTDPGATAAAVRRLAGTGGDKPLLASWMGGPEVEDGRAALSRAGIPVFAYPDTAARAFGAILLRITTTVGVIIAAIVLTRTIRFASGVGAAIIIATSILTRVFTLRRGLGSDAAAGERADHREHEEIHQLDG